MHGLSAVDEHSSGQLRNELDVVSSHRIAQPEYLCWTRMQVEAGQALESIIARKEIERRAGGGLFFWGVGNAPSTAINALARLEIAIPLDLLGDEEQTQGCGRHPIQSGRLDSIH